SDRLVPQRSEQVGQALRGGRVAEILPRITPADTFYLTAEFRRRFSGQTDFWGPSGQELENMSRRYPTELSWERLSQDFGVPHPILAQSYARELLNVKPFLPSRAIPAGCWPNLGTPVICNVPAWRRKWAIHVRCSISAFPR